MLPLTQTMRRKQGPVVRDLVFHLGSWTHFFCRVLVHTHTLCVRVCLTLSLCSLFSCLCFCLCLDLTSCSPSTRGRTSSCPPAHTLYCCVQYSGVCVVLFVFGPVKRHTPILCFLLSHGDGFAPYIFSVLVFSLFVVTCGWQ